MLLFSFCECHWIIPWLLPFLLGALLMWLWGMTDRKRVKELEEENAAMHTKIKGLEGDLSDCRAKRASLDSELTLLRQTIKEKEANMKSGLSTSSVAQTALGAVSGAAMQKAVTDTKKEKADPKSSITAPRKDVKSGNIYAVLSSDNLQVVEGIGPKMDEVLKSQGITNWNGLAGSTSESLRALLDKVNQKRYRIIDPTTWPEQARLADTGDWDHLIEYQKRLDTGRADKGAGQTDSKVEKLLIKLGALKRWKQDDLKAVEGIGPKIAGLLKAEGIDTWRKLSTTKVDRIQGILEAAGPRYRLADPETWPKQAEMAADGRWDDLDEYQDFLQGGK